MQNWWIFILLHVQVSTTTSGGTHACYISWPKRWVTFVTFQIPALLILIVSGSCYTLLKLFFFKFIKECNSSYISHYELFLYIFYWLDFNSEYVFLTFIFFFFNLLFHKHFQVCIFAIRWFSFFFSDCKKFSLHFKKHSSQ